MLGVSVDGTKQTEKEGVTFCPIIYPFVPPHTVLKLLCYSQLKELAEDQAACHFLHTYAHVTLSLCHWERWP